MKTNNQPSQVLNLIGSLSCSVSIVVSTVYIALCSVAIHFRSNCDIGLPDTAPSSDFFLRVLHKLYFKKDDCHNALLIDDVTQEHTVFLLTLLILVISIVCLISAIGFIVVLKLEDAGKLIVTFGYIYITACIISLVVDIVTAVFFGMDYSTFKSLMDNASHRVSIDHQGDMYRLSALFLMSLSLKLYVAPIINTIFIVLLIVYLIEYMKTVQDEGHSIHKVGALNGYDHPRRFEEPQSENSFQQFRPPQANPMFINDEESPRIINRENPRPESSNPSFDRSFSWQHNQPSATSRPFSYLEDIKSRAVPVKAPSPAREPQWSRDPWQPHAPPVPAPDYSPEAPRRLKSALKSSYM